jgi:hypothetical protein
MNFGRGKMTGFEAWLAQHSLLAQLMATIVGSFATFAAVLVAWQTAASTRATVREMRETRLQSIRPVLYISPKTHSFTVSLSPETSLYPIIEFKEGDQVIAQPFEVRNAVSSPAFDVQCRWRLGAEANLPADFKLAILNQAAEKRSMIASYSDGKITIADPNNSDAMWMNVNWAYSTAEKSNLKEILGDSAKGIDLPGALWKQLICLAMIALERRQIYSEVFKSISIPVNVELTCASPSGEIITKPFEFAVRIWWANIKGEDGKPIEQGSLPSNWNRVEFWGSLDTAAKEQVVLVNPTINDLWRAVANEAFATIRKFF